jgi:hypothetical protein
MMGHFLGDLQMETKKTKVVVLMLVAVGLMAGIAQANMLVNPGFEDGAFAAKGVADGWTASYASWTSAWTWFSGAGAHSGSKYLKLNGWSTGGDNEYYQYLPATENVEYTFSVWAKAAPGKTADAAVALYWYDNADVKIGGTIHLTPTTVGYNWTYVEWTSPAPAGTVEVCYSLEGLFSNGGVNKDGGGDGGGSVNADGGIYYDDAKMLGPDSNAPDVDAGPDMITWSEQPVTMDPNVVNNDVTALTYLWTAEPDTGVVISNVNIEKPNVTITKPALVSIAVAIANPGFETPVLADGDYTLDFTNCPGWSNVDVNTAGGVWNPGLPGTAFPGYGGNAPEGQNVAYVNSSGIKQVLTKTFAADTTYTLTVKVGNTDGFDWTGYKVQLLAGETVLAEDDNTVAIATGAFKTSTVAYTYDSGDSALLGQALQIRLLCLGSGGEADFDDVQLTAEGPAPDPYIVTLTLEANNVGAPPERARIDTMTIDVYDTACEAAKAAGLGTDNPGDFDGNCITDANDLDELAAKWLTGNPLTMPVAKP